MAIAFLRHSNPVNTISPNTTVSINQNGTTSAGTLIIVAVGMDNLTVSTPIVSSITKLGGDTATWVRLGYCDSPIAAAGGGTRVELWGIVTTVSWGVTSFDVTISAAPAKWGAVASFYSGVGAITRRGEWLFAYGSGVGSAQAVTENLGAGGTPVTGDLVIGAASCENNAAMTSDTDTLNGSWDTGNKTFTSGGGAAANMSLMIQHKIVTADGHQAYNAVGAGDASAVLVVLAGVPPAIPVAKTDPVGLTDSVVANITIRNVDYSDHVHISDRNNAISPYGGLPFTDANADGTPDGWVFQPGLFDTTHGISIPKTGIFTSTTKSYAHEFTFSNGWIHGAYARLDPTSASKAITMRLWNAAGTQIASTVTGTTEWYPGQYYYGAFSSPIRVLDSEVYRLSMDMTNHTGVYKGPADGGGGNGSGTIGFLHPVYEGAIGARPNTVSAYTCVHMDVAYTSGLGPTNSLVADDGTTVWRQLGPPTHTNYSDAWFGRMRQTTGTSLKLSASSYSKIHYHIVYRTVGSVQPVLLWDIYGSDPGVTTSLHPNIDTDPLLSGVITLPLSAGYTTRSGTLFTKDTYDPTNYQVMLKLGFRTVLNYDIYIKNIYISPGPGMSTPTIPRYPEEPDRLLKPEKNTFTPYPTPYEDTWLSDSVAWAYAALGTQVPLAEAIGLTDSVTIAFTKNHQEPAGLVDLRSIVTNLARVDPVGQVDTAQAGLLVSLNLSENIGLADAPVTKDLSKTYYDTASMLRDGGGTNILGIESSFETDTNLDGIADGWTNTAVAGQLAVVDSGALVAAIPGGHGSFSQSITVAVASGTLYRGILGPLVRSAANATTQPGYPSVHVSARVRPGGAGVAMQMGVVSYAADGVTPRFATSAWAQTLAAGATSVLGGYVFLGAGDVYVRPFVGFQSTGTGTLLIDGVMVADVAGYLMPAYDYFNPANRIQLTSGGPITRDYTDIASNLRDHGGVNAFGYESTFEIDSNADGLADGWLNTSYLTDVSPVDSVSRVVMASNSGTVGHQTTAQRIVVNATGTNLRGIMGPLVSARPGGSFYVKFAHRNPGASFIYRMMLVGFAADGVTPTGVGVNSASSTVGNGPWVNSSPQLLQAPLDASTRWVRWVFGAAPTGSGTFEIDAVMVWDAPTGVAGTTANPAWSYSDPSHRIQLTKAGAVKAGTLVDAFDSSIDSKWTSVGSGVAWSAGRAAFATAVDRRSWIETDYIYDLSESSVFVQPTMSVTQPGGRTVSFGLLDTSGAGFWIEMRYYYPGAYNMVRGVLSLNGVESAPSLSTYNVTNRAFWRIRHTGSQVHFEYSPTGFSWSEQSVVSSAGVNLAGMKVFLKVTSGSDEIADTVYFDNLNYAPPPPKFSTLTDDFTTLDAGKWQSVGAAIVGERLELTEISNNSGRALSGYYDLSGSAAFAQVQPHATADANRYTSFDLYSFNQNEGLYFDVDGTPKRVLLGWYTIDDGDESSVPYDPEDHAWWRIRESGGTAYWDASPDGISWSNLWSVVLPVDFPIQSLQLWLTCGHLGAYAGPYETAYFDNLNIAPAGGVTHTRDYTDDVFRPSYLTDVVDVPLVGTVFDHHDPSRWMLNSDASWAPDAYQITQDWGSIEVVSYQRYSVLSPGTRLFSKITFASAPTDPDCWGEFSVGTANAYYTFGVTDNTLRAKNTSVGTYDPVAHVYWGYRFETDGVHYETSPDGSTWTQVYYEPDTVARPVQWSAYQYWEFGGTDPNTMYIHSFNGLLRGVQDVTGLVDTRTAGIVAPPGATTGRPKAYTGTAFAEKAGKAWTGSAWVEKPWKKWTGTEWKPLGAAATIVGSTYANSNSLLTSMTMTLPSGLVNGDRIYIAAMCGDSSAGVTITESITGWTVVTAKADTGTQQRAFYTAIYSAGLVAPSWSLSVGRKNCYAAVAIRNPSATPAVSHTDLGSSTTALVAPSISSAPTGVLLRFYVRKDNLSTSVTPPSGTLVTGALGIATGPSDHVLVYSQTPAATTGTATLTMSVASANGTSWTVAL